MEKSNDMGGVSFTADEGEYKPPLAVDEDGSGPGTDRLNLEQEGEKVARTGKVPLHPAVIRLPFSIFGRVGTELTGYPGFTFTEQELNDLAELWMQTGVEMPPMMQAMVGTTAMAGGKVLGYYAWRRAGKPPVPGAQAIGTEEAE